MSVSLGLVLQQEQTDIQMIIQTLFSLAFIVYLFYAQRIQSLQMLRQIEVSVFRIKKIKEEAVKTTIKTITEVGKPTADITPRVERFMDHVALSLISIDPAGIIPKIDHFQKSNKYVYETEVKALAPAASEAERSTLENLLEVSQGLTYFYKAMRHNYLLGKKTMNIYIIMQVHMILPLVMQMIEAEAAGVQAFKNGMPIGDGVGPIVAAKLMRGYEAKEIAKEFVAAEVPYEGRNLIVMKAKGPGGSVGTPDEGLIRVLDEKQGQVKLVITVDAASKMEGVPVGSIAEGIGAAIGGGGKERFQMEAITVKYKVPMHCVLIQQGMEHVIAPLVEPLMDATDKAIESVKRIISDYSQPGDTVIVMGIGNTIGVGQ